MSFFLRKDVWVEATRQSALWIILYLFGYLRWDLRWLVLTMATGAALYAKFKSRLPWLEAAVTKATTSIPPDPAPTPAMKSSSFDQSLPAWVLHPDTQRAEWANVIVRLLWPHLEEYLRATLRTLEADDDLRRRLRGYHVRRLAFPRASLGLVPPKLSGVKVVTSLIARTFSFFKWPQSQQGCFFFSPNGNPNKKVRAIKALPRYTCVK